VALVAWPLLFVASPAGAQDPRCSRVRDKIGCNCAMQNGGWFTGSGNWVTRRGNAAPNEAFIRCMKRQGRG
jgi:hypothetical protein